MAKIEGRPTVGLEMRLILSEPEVRALDALMGYGIDPFLKTFYQMGEAYLKPHEAGLRSLFEQYHNLSVWISRSDEARKVFAGTHDARLKQLPPERPEIESDDALRQRCLAAQGSMSLQDNDFVKTATGSALDRIALDTFNLIRKGMEGKP